MARQTRCIACNALGHKTSCEAYNPGPYCDEHFKCAADGCTEKPRRRARYNALLCSAHVQRMDIYGSLREGMPIVVRTTSIGESVSLTAAHGRVYREFGSPKQYPCVKCGNTAHDWAYDGTDPTHLLGTPPHRPNLLKSWYSRYPEFYMPLCRSCHSKADRATMRDELNTYREFMFQKTLKGK